MRGVGGPLLCIGDLLSDVGEEGDGGNHSTLQTHSSKSPSSSSAPNSSTLNLHPSDLTKLFQENCDRLNEALGGTDQSWTALTLKLCTALETANILIQSTSSHVGFMSEKVGELERIIKRGDSAISEANALHRTLNQRKAELGQNSEHSRPDQLQG